MWLRVEIGLHRHRKVYALARALDCSRAEAVGMLTALWSYAAEQHPDGDITALDWLALGELFGVRGTDVPLIEALTATGWVDHVGPSACYLIHDWHDYQGRLIENMERERDRGRRRRGPSTENPQDIQPASTGRPPDVQEPSIGYVTERDETGRNGKPPSPPRVSGTSVTRTGGPHRMDAKAVQARSGEVLAYIQRSTLDTATLLRGHTEIIFAYWCAITNRRASVMLDKKRANRITARLRESGNNLVEALHVVDGLLKDDHLMARRPDSQRKYDGIETIFKDRATVERLSELGGYDSQPSHPFLDQLKMGV